MTGKKILIPILFVVVSVIGAASANARALFDEVRGIETLAPMLENVTSAVVNIAVVSKAPAETNPLFKDPYFRRFFDLPKNAPQTKPRMSAGSGVIIDSERGYVITNHHVVAEGDKVFVTLKDRRRLEAKIVGSDPGTDIALLQIKADDLGAIPIGNSDQLKVGDFVVAIGNPFGIGQTVTSGIVSALGRSGLNIEGYEDFIQTDASINPGNSGGALVDLKGKLIGINTAILAPGGGNVGIGFAIPSQMVRKITDQLIAYGEVRRGQLGVMIQDVTPDIAEVLGLDKAVGAVVSRVVPGSSADQAGLKAGDVITALNSRTVDNASALRNGVGLIPVGEKVRLDLLRNGGAQTVTAVIGQAQTAMKKPEPERVIGLALSDISKGSPLFGQIEGVVITDVKRGSAAWDGGLRTDDVIVGANRAPIASVKTFKSIVEGSGNVLALNVVRKGRMLFVVIRS